MIPSKRVLGSYDPDTSAEPTDPRQTGSDP